MKRLFLLFVSVLLLLTGTVYATNITIPDLNSRSISKYDKDYNTWWDRTNEDQEVEPGMVNTQQWDLEGFFTEGTSLTLIGGYNFQNGLEGYDSGDIFIDTNDDPDYGGSGDNNDDGYRTVNNSYGYNYVLDLDWSNKDNPLYNVYTIDSSSKVLTAYYHQNQGSSPWRYVSGGTKILSGGIIKYSTGLTDQETGFKGDLFDTSGTDLGGSHNKLVVDLGFLLPQGSNDSVNFTVHYTMGCGNDNIMGKGIIPNPEPATLILFGFGLLGIAGVCRKKF